jgi:tripartite-type tricarboxylate transporter receptor subunit TctC
MPVRRRTITLAGTLAALGLADPWPVAAQDGSVSIVVPYTPGTGQDVLARLIAPVLQGALGQTCVVENRPGASGIIGSQAVARAAPDGRTLMLQANTFVMAPAMTRQASYDPRAGFTPIIHLTNGELVLAVHPSTGCETAAALVAFSRGRPGGIDYASPGNGTPQHLAMELFRLEAGRPEMNHVPYRGSAPAVQDLLAGRVAAMVLPLHTALPLAADGRIRMLAVGSRVRSPAAAQVPTMAEAGFAGAEVDLWYGLLGPAGMPAAAVARINAVLRDWLVQPATAETLRAQGMMPARDPSPEAFAALIGRDQARWAGVIARAGISAD